MTMPRVSSLDAELESELDAQLEAELDGAKPARPVTPAAPKPATPKPFLTRWAEGLLAAPRASATIGLAGVRGAIKGTAGLAELAAKAPTLGSNAVSEGIKKASDVVTDPIRLKPTGPVSAGDAAAEQVAEFGGSLIAVGGVVSKGTQAIRALPAVTRILRATEEGSVLATKFPRVAQALRGAASNAPVGRAQQLGHAVGNTAIMAPVLIGAGSERKSSALGMMADGMDGTPNTPGGFLDRMASNPLARMATEGAIDLGAGAAFSGALRRSKPAAAPGLPAPGVPVAAAKVTEAATPVAALPPAEAAVAQASPANAAVKATRPSKRAEQNRIDAMTQYDKPAGPRQATKRDVQRRLDGMTQYDRPAGPRLPNAREKAAMIPGGDLDPANAPRFMELLDRLEMLGRQPMEDAAMRTPLTPAQKSRITRGDAPQLGPERPGFMTPLLPATTQNQLGPARALLPSTFDKPQLGPELPGYAADGTFAQPETPDFLYGQKSQARFAMPASSEELAMIPRLPGPSEPLPPQLQGTALPLPPQTRPQLMPAGDVEQVQMPNGTWGTRPKQVRMGPFGPDGLPVAEPLPRVSQYAEPIGPFDQRMYDQPIGPRPERPDYPTQVEPPSNPLEAQHALRVPEVRAAARDFMEAQSRLLDAQQVGGQLPSGQRLQDFEVAQRNAYRKLQSALESAGVTNTTEMQAIVDEVTGQVTGSAPSLARTQSSMIAGDQIRKDGRVVDVKGGILNEPGLRREAQASGIDPDIEDLISEETGRSTIPGPSMTSRFNRAGARNESPAPEFPVKGPTDLFDNFQSRIDNDPRLEDTAPTREELEGLTPDNPEGPAPLPKVKPKKVGEVEAGKIVRDEMGATFKTGEAGGGGAVSSTVTFADGSSHVLNRAAGDGWRSADYPDLGVLAKTKQEAAIHLAAHLEIELPPTVAVEEGKILRVPEGWAPNPVVLEEVQTPLGVIKMPSMKGMPDLYERADYMQGEMDRLREEAANRARRQTPAGETGSDPRAEEMLRIREAIPTPTTQYGERAGPQYRGNVDAPGYPRQAGPRPATARQKAAQSAEALAEAQYLRDNPQLGPALPAGSRARVSAPATPVPTQRVPAVMSEEDRLTSELADLRRQASERAAQQAKDAQLAQLRQEVDALKRQLNGTPEPATNSTNVISEPPPPAVVEAPPAPDVTQAPAKTKAALVEKQKKRGKAAEGPVTEATPAPVSQPPKPAAAKPVSAASPASPTTGRSTADIWDELGPLERSLDFSPEKGARMVALREELKGATAARFKAQVAKVATVSTATGLTAGAVEAQGTDDDTDEDSDVGFWTVAAGVGIGTALLMAGKGAGRAIVRAKAAVPEVERVMQIAREIADESVAAAGITPRLKPSASRPPGPRMDTESINPREIVQPTAKNPTGRLDPYNLDRLGLSPELKAEAQAYIDAQVRSERTVVSNAETEALAAKLVGMDPADFRARIDRTRVTDGETLVALAAMARHRLEQIDALGVRLADPTTLTADVADALKAQMLKLGEEANWALRSRERGGSEVGRAMQALQISDQITSPFYWQAKASKLAQRDLSVEEFSDLNKLASSNDPKDKVRLLQRVAEMERMSIPKMLARIEVAGYLSRPAGRVKDMVSSFGNMVMSQKVEKPMRVMLDKLFEAGATNRLGLAQQGDMRTELFLPLENLTRRKNEVLARTKTMLMGDATAQGNPRLAKLIDTAKSPREAAERWIEAMRTPEMDPTLIARGELPALSRIRGLFLNADDPRHLPGQLGKLGSGPRATADALLDLYVQVTGKATGIADKIVRSMAYDVAMQNQATAMAHREGLRGAARATRAAEIAATSSTNAQLTGRVLDDVQRLTFINDGVASRISHSIRRAPGKIASQAITASGGSEALARSSKDVVDALMTAWVMPFPRVPANIASRMVDYSPLGVGRAAYESRQWMKELDRVLAGIAKGKAGDIEAGDAIFLRDGRLEENDALLVMSRQRKAIDKLTKATVGTFGFMWLGGILAKEGAMVGAYPKNDPNKKGLRDLDNAPANSILIGGQWRPITWLGPQGMMMAMGATLMESLTETPDDAGVSDYATNVGGATAQVMLDQPMVQGVASVSELASEPARYAPGFVRRQAGSLVPSAVGAIAQGADGIRRKPESVADAVQAKIPGLASGVPAARTALGDPVKAPLGVWNQLFNPFAGPEDGRGRAGVTLGGLKMQPAADATSQTIDVLATTPDPDDPTKTLVPSTPARVVKATKTKPKETQRQYVERLQARGAQMRQRLATFGRVPADKRNAEQVQKQLRKATRNPR